MKIFDSIAGLQGYLDLQRNDGKTIGLVPTMGALHFGHAHLIQQSVKTCDVTACSIFVNPTQFNNSEDLLKYPRRIEEDRVLLEDEGCDVVFMPAVEEMYPKGSKALSMDFGFLESVLEGAFRPGHFSGVGVVVSKLFNIVQPNLAFFGQKDLQQLAIIKKLVKDLNIRTTIVAVPTVRESSGLAMSSRNLRLSERQRQLAANLYRLMKKIKSDVLAGIPISKALDLSTNELTKLEGIELEYLDVVDSNSMSKVTQIEETANVSVCIAAHIGEVRLIDNLYLKQQD